MTPKTRKEYSAEPLTKKEQLDSAYYAGRLAGRQQAQAETGETINGQANRIQEITAAHLDAESRLAISLAISNGIATGLALALLTFVLAMSATANAIQAGVLRIRLESATISESARFTIATDAGGIDESGLFICPTIRGGAPNPLAPLAPRLLADC
jgi:hypothetical protein